MESEEERYDGERRGLSLFLSELQPLVVDQLGPNHILVSAIDRALASECLSHLRHAKHLFNRLARQDRQNLSQGIVANPGQEPDHSDIIQRYRENEPATFVSISSTEDETAPGPWRFELAHELLDAPAIRVLIKPGTLPSTAAKCLRDIADRLERDRRLLSKRHWREEHIKEVTQNSGVDVG